MDGEGQGIVNIDFAGLRIASEACEEEVPVAGYSRGNTPHGPRLIGYFGTPDIAGNSTS